LIEAGYFLKMIPRRFDSNFLLGVYCNFMIYL